MPFIFLNVYLYVRNGKILAMVITFMEQAYRK